ncbi:flippase [Enterocloster aldenensis]|uniref:flippase n=1 Tax=Enterocloster aldenensis TaxID=358742 RepID=UPI000E51AF5C|nr:flippase [Enterocloster aldenensis]
MKIKSIKENALLNLIYTISNMIFPLITFPYVSRVLKADGMGKVSFFTAIANYAIMLASLGISTYGVRAIAKVRDDKAKLSKTFGELVIINLLVTLVVITVLAISVPFIEKFNSEPTLVLIHYVLIISSVFGVNWLYFGLEQYTYITIRSIIFKIISLFFVFILVNDRGDYNLYAGITVFSLTGSYIVNFIYARNFISFKRRKLDLKQHYRPMLLLFASILAISVYTNLDVVMLGFISGDEEVGLYTVAVKIKSLLLTAVNALSIVLLPRLSYYISVNKKDEYNKILKKSISMIFMLSVPLTVFFIINAKNSLLLLGGHEYENAVLCMQILMPILLISGFSNITGNQILIPLGKDLTFMKAVIIGSIVNLLFNCIFMPKYGCIGAAVATLVAEITQMGIQFKFSSKYVMPNIMWKTIIKITISSILAGVSTVLLNPFVSINIIVNFLISVLIFFGVYIVILLILREKLLMPYVERICGAIRLRYK